MSFVYLLLSTGNATYVGATVNLERRVRQHNGELKGGANATSIRVNKGETWSPVCYVKNFPDWSAALQFEWKWKFLTRKQSRKLSTIERRLSALHLLLVSEKSTSNAKPFSEWDNPPEIMFKNDVVKTLFETDYNNLIVNTTGSEPIEMDLIISDVSL